MINIWKTSRLDKHLKLLEIELQRSNKIRIGNKILLTSGIRPLSKKELLNSLTKEVCIHTNQTDLRLLKPNHLNLK